MAEKVPHLMPDGRTIMVSLKAKAAGAYDNLGHLDRRDLSRAMYAVRTIVGLAPIGGYVLPRGIEEAKQLLETIRAAYALRLARAPESPDVPVGSGDPADALGAWQSAASKAAEDEEFSRQSMAGAHDLAQTRLLRILVDNLQSIRDCLQVALAETIAETRDYAPSVRGIDADDARAAIKGGPATTAAFEALERLADRLGAIRRAQSALRLVSPHDERGEVFQDFRDVYSVFPAVDRHLGPDADSGPKPPWPTGRHAYLLWLATSGVEAWVPSPAQEAEAIAERRAATVNPARRAALGAARVNP